MPFDRTTKIVRTFNPSIFQPDTPPAAIPTRKGGLWDDVQRGTGQMVGSVGSSLEDFGPTAGIGHAMEDWGNDLAAAHPSEINSLGDIVSKPGTAVREAIGENVPQIGAIIAGGEGGRLIGGGIGAGIGAGVAAPTAEAGGVITVPLGAEIGQEIGGRIGGAIPTYLQEYGSIRQTQRQLGTDNVGGAILGGLGATALEFLFGPEAAALRAAARAPKHAVGNLLTHTAKEAAGEGLTEFLQTGVERLSSGQDLTNEDALNDYAISTFKGAAAGGALGPLGHALRPGRRAAEPTPEPAINPDPAGTTDLLSPHAVAGGGDIYQGAAQPVEPGASPADIYSGAAIPPIGPAPSRLSPETQDAVDLGQENRYPSEPDGQQNLFSRNAMGTAPPTQPFGLARDYTADDFADQAPIQYLPNSDRAKLANIDVREGRRAPAVVPEALRLPAVDEPIDSSRVIPPDPEPDLFDTEHGMTKVLQRLRAANPDANGFPGPADAFTLKLANAVSDKLTSKDPAAALDHIDKAAEALTTSSIASTTIDRRVRALDEARTVVEDYKKRAIAAAADRAATPPVQPRPADAVTRPGAPGYVAPVTEAAPAPALIDTPTDTSVAQAHDQNAAMAARDQATQFESDLQVANAHIDQSFQRQQDDFRHAQDMNRKETLQKVLDDPTTRNPVGRFIATLRAQGHTDLSVKPEEAQTISRFEAAKDALPPPAEDFSLRNPTPETQVEPTPAVEEPVAEPVNPKQQEMFTRGKNPRPTKAADQGPIVTPTAPVAPAVDPEAKPVEPIQPEPEAAPTPPPADTLATNPEVKPTPRERLKLPKDRAAVAQPASETDAIREAAAPKEPTLNADQLTDKIVKLHANGLIDQTQLNQLNTLMQQGNTPLADISQMANDAARGIEPETKTHEAVLRQIGHVFAMGMIDAKTRQSLIASAKTLSPDQLTAALHHEVITAKLPQRLDATRREFLRGAGAAVAAVATAPAVRATAQATTIDDAVKTGKVENVVKWVAANSKDEGRRSLANRLLAGGFGGATIRAVTNNSPMSDITEMAAKAGATTVNTGEVMLNKLDEPGSRLEALRGGMNEETALHEAVHSWVSARYRTISTYTLPQNKRLAGFNKVQAGEKAVNDWVSIWNSVGEVLKTRPELMDAGDPWASEFYRDPDEALAWSMTHKAAQDFLRSIDTSGKPIKSPAQKNMFDRFIDWVAKLLGVSQADHSMLKKVLDAGNAVIAHGTLDTPDHAFASSLARAALAHGQNLSERAAEDADALFARNQKWAKPLASYQTKLTPTQEAAFQTWLKDNNVPFDPTDPKSDYDMRGFWRGLMSGDPHAKTEINTNDHRLHFTDWWKTPYHRSFSRDSQYARSTAPHWANDHQLVDAQGKVVFDERTSQSNMLARKAPADEIGKLITDTKLNAGDNLRDLGLKSMTLFQMVNRYGAKLPSFKGWYDGLMQSSQRVNRYTEVAHALALRWRNLKTDAKPVGELLLDATHYQIDPRKPLDPTHDAARHKELSDRLAALSPEARKVFGDVLQSFSDKQDLKKALWTKLIKETEPDPARQAQAIRDVNELFRQNQVYFPLSRFGRHLVVGRKPSYAQAEAAHRDAVAALTNLADDATTAESNAARAAVTATRATMNAAKDEGYVVQAADSRAEQIAISKQLTAEGYTTKEMLREAFDHNVDGVDSTFVNRLTQAMAAYADAAPEVVKGMQALVREMYLTSLPDHSALKRSVPRKNIAGFERDAQRSFASASIRDAFFLSRLEFGQQSRARLARMRTEAVAGDYGDQQVYDVIKQHHAALLNYNETPIQDKIANVGYLWYLGVTPAFGVINMLQTPMITMPHLAARHGLGRSVAALTKAMTDISGIQISAFKNGGWQAEVPIDKLTSDPGEQAMLQHLLDRGRIDLTMGHDLGSTANGDDPRWRTMMKVATWLPHYTEKVNRIGSALAAYRLAKLSKMADPIGHAEDIVTGTHFDYSRENTPLLFKTLPWAKVLLQFKKYQQAMGYMLIENARLSLPEAFNKDATPEQRTLARRTLFGLVATHALVAGSLGVPGAGAAIFALDMLMKLFTDDDDPWDTKTEWRKFLADVFGKEGGEIAAKGLPTALGVDLSQRAGQGDVFNPLRTRGMNTEGRDAFAQYVASATGPAGAIVGDLFEASKQFHEGNVARGWELMMPKVVRDILRTKRFNDEGITTESGNTLVPPADISAWDKTLQMLGFMPAKLSEHYDAQSSELDRTTAQAETRKLLLQRFATAKVAGDAEAMAAVRAEVDAYNANRAKDGDAKPITMSSLLKAAAARGAYGKSVHGGVHLPGTGGAEDEGDYAVTFGDNDPEEATDDNVESP